MAGVIPFKIFADLANIGILAVNIAASLFVIIFRYTKPDTPSTFRLPNAATALRGMSEVRGLAGGQHGHHFTYCRKHSRMNPDSPRQSEQMVLPHGQAQITQPRLFN